MSPCKDGFNDPNECPNCVSDSYEVIIQRVKTLIDIYLEKHRESNPLGYGESLNDRNSISYWRVAQELRQALDGEDIYPDRLIAIKQQQSADRG